MSEPSVIALEFNELTPKLMLDWIAQGHLPGFKRLFGESRVFVTDAEERPPLLEPWIQWITVHTGLSYADHKVFDLGDGHKLKAPRLWDLVSAAGKKVWICGSMNAGKRDADLNGAILPDPWSVGLVPHPPGVFDAFYHFVRTYVQEYSRNDVPLKAADYARFATFMISHGLSPKTIRRTVAQLASERGADLKWKRAMILDRLCWDVFRAQWRRLRPSYSTLFLNSTAHLQHYHWRNMDPAAFAIRPSATEQATYQDAILEGYRAMDAIVSEALDMIAGTDTSLVLVTALGQQALTRYEDEGGKQVFKPHDALGLLRFAGFDAPARYAPVMAEEYHLYLDSEASAAAAEAALGRLDFDGQPLMKVRRQGDELFAACAVTRMPDDLALVRVAGTERARRFKELFFPVQGLKSGGHHPDGIFWVRTADRRHEVTHEKVSLRRVAPTLAALAGLPQETIASAFAAAPLLPPAPSKRVAAGQAANEPAALNDL